MSIVVEFYGIPRARAGVQCATVCKGKKSASLADVLVDVLKQIPEFAEICLTGGRLRDGFTVSIDGQCFVRDETAVVAAGQIVMIFSSDAGG